MALSEAALAQRKRRNEGVCVEPGCGSTDLMRYQDGLPAVRCAHHEAMMVRNYMDRNGLPSPEWAESLRTG